MVTLHQPAGSASARLARSAADVIVVDRSPAFAEGLAHLLEELGHAACHATFATAERRSARRAPDVVLLDADGDHDELAGLAEALRAATDHLEVILLVADSDTPPSTLAQLAGAAGCVSRRASARTLDLAIRRVRSGGEMAPLVGSSTGSRRQVRAGRRTALSRLTARELLVLRTMMTGRRGSEIADLLGISPHTVRTHVQNILAKLAVHTRAEAGVLALRAGLLPLHDASAVLSGSGR